MDEAINQLLYDEIGKRRSKNGQKDVSQLTQEVSNLVGENCTDILSLLLSAKDETGRGMSDIL